MLSAFAAIALSLALGARTDPSLAMAVQRELLRPGREAAQERLLKFYAQRGGAPIWLIEGQPSPRVAEALATLRGSEADGLDPDDYDLGPLETEAHSLIASDPVERLARFDVNLSAALAQLIQDLHAGRAEPAVLAPRLDRGLMEGRLSELTTQALFGNPQAAYAAARPKLPLYARLRTALLHYRELANANPESRLPPLRAKLRPGQSWEGLPALAERLKLLGDLPSTASAPGLIYDGEMVQALARFQTRHGQTADGILGPETYASLTAPLDRCVRQLQLGLERLRWVDDILQSGPIVGVNIPQFTLWARGTDPDQAALRMRVVVGRAFRQWRTPVFLGQMSSVLFSPPWDAPLSIAREEILPKWKADPSYLEREESDVVDQAGRVVLPTAPGVPEAIAKGQLRIRQRPGAKNPLDGVKFVFPNSFSVYLHGTPEHTLFNRSRRDFSHGCIRVEDPVALARFVLDGLPGWDEAQIRDAMASGKAQEVLLKAPIPVLIFYITVYVETDGRLVFLPDIYGHDRRLEAALQKLSGRNPHYGPPKVRP